MVLGCLWAGGTGADTYRLAASGYRYSFPRDHFEHPEFRTEWWYYTGNLRDAAGKRFGFELVFFRRGERRGEPDNLSAWRIDDLYLAHLALTDIDGKRFYNYRRLNRAGPGLAGASFAERRVWNGNWSASWQGERQVLQATADDFQFRLELDPVKPPVIHGLDGISRKGSGADQGCYQEQASLHNICRAFEGYCPPLLNTMSCNCWMDAPLGNTKGALVVPSKAAQPPNMPPKMPSEASVPGTGSAWSRNPGN